MKSTSLTYGGQQNTITKDIPHLIVEFVDIDPASVESADDAYALRSQGQGKAYDRPKTTREDIQKRR